MTSFLSLARAMFLGFRRDRAALFFTILFPLLFLVLFGGVFKDSGPGRAKVLQVGPVAVLDQAVAADGQGLAEVLTITRTDDRSAALAKVRRGDYAAVVEQRGDQIVVDYSAADVVRAGTVRSVMTSLVDQANLAASGRPPSFALRTEQVEDRSLTAIQYVTPGILGWAIATGAGFAAASTLVSWRDKKILRRLRLAPVHIRSVIAARVVVSLGVALIQTAIFIAVASLPYFGLKLSHAWWMSIPLIMAGTLAFLSIGLLAGAKAKTMEAANVITNLIVLPMAFLSGSFVPIDASPAWIRTVSQIFPLRHLNDAMLDVMVRGRGPLDVLPQLGLLLGFAVVVSAVAARMFRWDDV